MIYEDQILRYVRAFVQNRDRTARYAFNDGIKKYKYLTVYPYGSDDESDFYLIGFTNKHFKVPVGDDKLANMRVDGDSCFYVTTPHAMMFRTDMQFSTDRIEPVIISPVTLDDILCAPKLSDGEFYHVSYCVTDYMNTKQHLSYENEADIIKAAKGLRKIELEVFFEDTHTTTTTIYGSRGIRLMHNGTCIALIHAYGRELSNQETSVINEVQYRQLMEELIDAVPSLREKMDTPYKLVDHFDQMDRYCPVPGITGKGFGVTTKDKL